MLLKACSSMSTWTPDAVSSAVRWIRCRRHEACPPLYIVGCARSTRQRFAAHAGCVGYVWLANYHG